MTGPQTKVCGPVVSLINKNTYRIYKIQSKRETFANINEECLPQTGWEKNDNDF